MSISRVSTWILAVSVTVLSGCGSTPPPAPSAAKDIDSAKSSMDSARMMEKQNQIDAALGHYTRAKEAISRGKEVAEGSELSQLNSMEDEARKQISALQIKKITQANQPEKPKIVAVASGPKSEDPEEKKKREEAAIEAKRKADQAKQTAALDATFSKGVSVGKPKEKTEDEESATPAKGEKGDKVAGAKKVPGKEGDEEQPADEAKKPIKAAKGPFPAVTEQSPEIEIVKLTVKGKFAIAYFQVYNKKENGRRIMNHAIYFKNANGQEVISDRSVQTYNYNGFKADIADPTNQSIDGLTVGSHQINGMEAMQFAAVGQHDMASNVKQVGVIVVFDDGSKLSTAGPAGGVDLNAGGGATNTIKGLKTK